MTRRLLPYGPTAWLVEVTDEVVLDLVRPATELPGVGEVVPAERTLLVHVRRGADAEVVGASLLTLRPRPLDDDVEPPTVTMPVVYDGEDLATVAEASGLSIGEVVERHIGGIYRCAFCGFAPGFAYLTGLDPALHLPRRATPRTRVPAGAVAIAAAYTAVYPTASPGGWHLLGRTDATLFDPWRRPPALIEPGTTVRFEDRG